MNEIETTVRRAAAGIGLAPGLAEDAGRMAAWLAVAGLDDLAAVRRALDLWRHDPARSALQAGPAACDLVRASGSQAAPVVLEAMDEPLLIVAAAAIATEAGGSLRVTWPAADVTVTVDCRAGRPSLRIAGSPDATLRSGAVDVAIGPPVGPPAGSERLSPGDFDARLRAILERGCSCPDETWAALADHATRILVPASEESRVRGAGAGLVDTD